MAKSPDERQIFHCPTCNGKRQVPTTKPVQRGGKTKQETVYEDCKTCDGSGSIVGPPA